MNKQPERRASAEEFGWLDATCDRFEQCWRAGQRPKLEDYVAEGSGWQRDVLLRELLALEIELRQVSGETPTAAEYLVRFAADARLVEKVLAEAGVAGAAHRPTETPVKIAVTGLALEVVDGPERGRRFTFTGHEHFVVGRSSKAHLRMPKSDRRISRYHFVLEINPPTCRLLDLGSRNGTYVNGRQVRAADLQPGDRIRAGSTMMALCSWSDEADRTKDRTTSPMPETAPYVRPPRPAPKPVPACETRDWHSVDAEVQPVENRPRVPGYTVVRSLGRGGMGIVYLARRNDDGRKAAIKMIQSVQAAGDLEVQRLLREAEILRSLRHEKIVAFHEVGQCEDAIYFVMDYVPGTDAAELLRRHGRLPVGRAVRLICDALEGLDYAHQCGFVHRDVKPANLLVTAQNGVEVCRLADFGLARIYQTSTLSGLTLLGDVAGALAYMPPEQITAYRDVRPFADLYSTAASLYHLLTGRFIYDFPPGDQRAGLAQILTEVPIPIRSRRPEIPDDLAALIHRALARDPKKRFPDARAMKDCLVSFC